MNGGCCAVLLLFLKRSLFRLDDLIQTLRERKYNIDLFCSMKAADMLLCSNENKVQSMSDIFD